MRVGRSPRARPTTSRGRPDPTSTRCSHTGSRTRPKPTGPGACWPRARTPLAVRRSVAAGHHRIRRDVHHRQDQRRRKRHAGVRPLRTGRRYVAPDRVRGHPADRRGGRTETPDTVGYSHLKDFGTPGYRKSSRSYSQQYERPGRIPKRPRHRESSRRTRALKPTRSLPSDGRSAPVARVDGVRVLRRRSSRSRPQSLRRPSVPSPVPPVTDRHSLRPRRRRKPDRSYSNRG